VTKIAEGPRIVSKQPVKMNIEYKQKPLLNTYFRMYAPMIIKRKTIGYWHI
jgi:hypothetical protein